ncbi:hypothetical protein T484DRAFT_1808400 [Baffinella frigidus]|nr:hypothetical protein T484DRAFT_1808400 [Cryptophyta sp. CCMP2293]
MAYNRGGGVLPNVFEDEGQRRKREYLQELQAQAEADRLRKLGEKDGFAVPPGGQGQDQFRQQQFVPNRGGVNQNQNQVQNPVRYAGPAPPYGQQQQQQQQQQQRGYVDQRARGSYQADQHGEGHERERYAQKLRASFDMALDAANAQILRGANDLNPQARDALPDPLVQGMKRWEDLFVGQVSTSVDAVQELARRLSEMEGHILQSMREKQALTDRVNQAELGQSDLLMSRAALHQAPQHHPAFGV